MSISKIFISLISILSGILFSFIFFILAVLAHRGSGLIVLDFNMYGENVFEIYMMGVMVLLNIAGLICFLKLVKKN